MVPSRAALVELAAGSTPGGPEVDQHWYVAAADVPLEGGFVQRDRMRGEQGLVALAAVGLVIEVVERQSVGGVAVRADDVLGSAHGGFRLRQVAPASMRPREGSGLNTVRIEPFALSLSKSSSGLRQAECAKANSAHGTGSHGTGSGLALPHVTPQKRREGCRNARPDPGSRDPPRRRRSK